ncbi:TfuA-like protein [Catenovulum sediminis]|uniref:TfuA-like protein n=1 Tax=Catenovulum sediminis TaxID=1740262 RepID=A0ABV1RID1_9ALTE
MYFDQRKPVAVFLGPSLPLEVAKNILDANYYPPVRFGDIYQLLTTGIKTIIIIDGIFHGSTPVWHREIIAALDAGIRVYGASSMGALRARELAHLGMQGHGKIFQWFYDNELDGDDEVALLHTDGHFNYQKISEPLVNIRATLLRAAEQGVISKRKYNELITDFKKRYFGDRSLDGISEFNSFKAMSKSEQTRLLEYLSCNYNDLKSQDAQDVLMHCKKYTSDNELPTLKHIYAPWYPTRYCEYESVNLKNRGVLDTNNKLVKVSDLFAKMVIHSLFPQYFFKAQTKFYLQQWFMLYHPKQHCLPPSYQLQNKSNLHLFLRNNALLYSEYVAEQKWSLLIQAEFKRLDLCNEFKPFIKVVEILAKVDNKLDMLQQAKESFLIVKWADKLGLTIPQEDLDKFCKQWIAQEKITDLNMWLCSKQLTREVFDSVWRVRATYHWLINMGPSALGFSGWNPELAVFRQFQLDDHVSLLLQKTVEKTAKTTKGIVVYE